MTIDGSIYLFTNKPGSGYQTIPWPKHRWQHDTHLGTELRTLGMLPRGLHGSDTTYELRDQHVIYQRSYQGPAGLGKPTRRTRSDAVGQPVALTYTFTFRVDPTYGYVIDADLVTKTQQRMSHTPTVVLHRTNAAVFGQRLVGDTPP